MSRNVYIATNEAHSGKSAISLGIVEMMVKNIRKVGFFRPIIQLENRTDRDSDIELICDHFKLDVPYGDTFAYTVREAEEFVHKGKTSDLIDGILSKYSNLADKYDFIVCEGTDFEGVTSAFEFDINAEIARNLNCPVVAVTDGRKGDLDEIIASKNMAVELFEEKNCTVAASIINRVPLDKYDRLLELLQARTPPGDRPVYAVPNEPTLSNPLMSEVVKALNAEVLYGHDLLNLEVKNYKIAAASLETFLDHLREGCLIITPGDRVDILLGTLLSINSLSFSNIAGFVLTNNIKPKGPVEKLLKGLKTIVPILSVTTDTFTTTTLINSLHPRISKGFTRKITTALSHFEKHIDTEKLFGVLQANKSSVVTPKMFEYYLIQRAREPRQRIVLPEGEEPRILQAAEQILRRGVADLTLLGKKKEIENKISLLGLDLKKAEIIEPLASESFEDYVKTYYELRKHRQMTMEIAHNLLQDGSYFGTMMVYKGQADGMVSGSINTTEHTLRPALQFIRTKEGFTIASSVFFMCLKDRVLVYGDCAVNPNPTAEQLAEIAVTSAQTAQTFGIEPRVALLSYSTGTSGKGEDVEKVRKATDLARQIAPDLLIEGPIQYDAAISPEVAKTKMPNSKVAGHATVFIFPDLNTGNNTYKAVQRSAGAVAIGPVMQGLRKPVNDLSRGCTVTDVVNTIAITAIQAQVEHK